MFANQEMRSVRIIVMTGVEMDNDMTIPIIGIPEETCTETWRSDVTTEISSTGMAAIRTAESKMDLFVKMRLTEFLWNVTELGLESHTQEVQH